MFDHVSIHQTVSSSSQDRECVSLAFLAYTVHDLSGLQSISKRRGLHWLVDFLFRRVGESRAFSWQPTSHISCLADACQGCKAHAPLLRNLEKVCCHKGFQASFSPSKCAFCSWCCTSVCCRLSSFDMILAPACRIFRRPELTRAPAGHGSAGLMTAHGFV